MKFTEADLTDELAGMYPILPERRPGGVTISEMARIWHVGYRAAYDRMRELEQKGTLISEVVRGSNGRGVTVFYKNVP